MSLPPNPPSPDEISTVIRSPRPPETPPASGSNDAPTLVRQPQLTDLKSEKPAATPAPAILNFGEYELLSEIARGGMGVVYKARHRELNRVVALKMILSGRLADEQEVRRFYNEAKTAAGLQHPGIVAIHDIGQVQEQHFFSMEYVEGQSLKDLIVEDALPPEESAGLLKSMAEAIHYAHGRGVLHRDLKPHNVLIDPHGQPRITDFGLAKQLDVGSELTATGAVLGTPNYMAPEQAAGMNDLVGPASDVYGLGAVLYEMLTGRPPFRAETLAATLLEVVENDPVPPRTLNRQTPRDLETICLKCLAKEPARRYASAADLAGDLDLFLRGEPITARPLSTPGRVLRWSRQKPFLAIVCGSTAVFTCFHLLAVLLLRKRADDGNFVWIASGIIVAWFLSGLAINRLLESDRWHEAAGYAFAVSGLSLFAIGMLADRGPVSAPIVMMYSSMGLAALLAPSVRLVWFTTALAAAYYVAIALYVNAYRRADRVSAEHAAAFLVGLVVMGMVTHLLLRRTRVTGTEISGSKAGSKGTPRSSRRGQSA